LGKYKIAIATNGYDGLEDTVSNIFGKAKTFTVVNVEDGKTKNVRIIDNPAAVYEHGSGPIAAKALAELRVDLVIASQLGPGALELLEYHKITPILVKPGSTVAESVKEAVAKLAKQNP
jgi:predicted Fe-Mo cluster-binding NifX family protein